MKNRERENRLLNRPDRFFLRVLHNFRENQGLLLAGGIAYHTLLSVVPILLLTLIALSQFIEDYKLLQTVSTHLGMIIPSYAAALTTDRSISEHREVIIT
jgi:uncharacterized BrkB/YihY/UPF0761 family membrane protein